MTQDRHKTRAAPPLALAQAQRCAKLAQDTARLAMRPPEPSTFSELVELGRASADRMTALQKGWLRDWSDWAAYAGSIAGADTVPKFTERAGNIALRAEAQLQKQINQTTDLGENILVSYGFWLSKRLGDDEPG